MGALSGVQLRLVESLDDALRFRSWLGERRPVLGIDTETSGLESWKQRLRLVQVGDADTGWAIPWEAPGWGGMIAEALAQYDGELVAHNAMFDLRFLERNGCPIPRERLHDTSVMAHLTNPIGNRQLKYLGKTIIDSGAALGEEALHEGMTKNRWDWGTVPIDFPPYWVYSALDPVITARLWEHFHPIVSSRFQQAYDLEMAVAQVTSDMHVRGMRVDLDYTRQKQAGLQQFVEQQAAWIEHEFGVKPGSNQGVAAKLIRDGVTLTKVTDSGALSVDSDALSDVDHPLAQAVLDYRKGRDFEKRYFRAILECADGDLIHPEINPLGARTARMSVSKPPFQQLPSGSPLVRDCVVPREGNRLALCDFDQIEVRLLAHFAQEQTMIAAIHAGEDLHWSSARAMYGPGATKTQRKMSKSGTFGKIYGIGVDKFASQQGVTAAEAAAFLNHYDRTFPGVGAFISEVETLGRQRSAAEGQAYVTTPIGRRHPLEKRSNAYYRLVNYLIQGTAADVLKQKLVALSAAGLGEYLVLPVHDEVIADVPTDLAEEVARKMRDVMEDRTSFCVPLTAEPTVVDRWGDPYREAA